MTENFTPADLIYLYLDGEADTMQQTTMFAALASDPELQQEFSEALSMRRAFEHERSNAKPPLYLTTRVMQDAGVLPKALGVGALGGGLMMWLRKAALPVGSLLLGSAVTFFAMNWISNTGNTDRARTEQSSSELRNKTAEQSATQTSSASASNTISNQNSYQASNGVSAFASPASAGAANSTYSSSTVESDRARYRAASHVSTAGAARSKSIAIPNEMNSAASKTVAQQAAPKVNVENMNAGANDVSQSEGINEPWAPPPAVIQNVSAYENTSYSKKLSMVNVPVSPFNAGKTSDFTLQLNRLASASVQGVVPGNSNIAFVAEPSLSVYYNLNENASIGAGFTSGRYAISNITKSGEALQNPKLSCWTIEYQRISAEEFMLGAQGFAKVGSGLSWNSGATLGLLNGSVGLSFPVAFLQLNTGMAFETFWYQTQSSGIGPKDTKISFVIGLGYNW